MISGQADANSVRIAVVSSDPAFRRMINDQLSGMLEDRLMQPCDFQIFDDKAPATFLMEPSCALVTFEDEEDLKSLSRLASRHPNMLLLALSENGSVSRAVASMQAGAHDFVARPVTAAALSSRLSELLAQHRPAPHPTRVDVPARANATSDAADTKSAPSQDVTEAMLDFEGFIGKSPAMQGVYDQILRIAASKAPVFITGESGTGKEVCAQALHSRSNRGKGPFIAINCSAIPSDLMESELFGHMRGSFTGASEDRKGAAELADGGTLFLDEIGEMPHDLQAKLLRLIQTGTLRRVGGREEISLDIRFCRCHQPGSGRGSARRPFPGRSLLSHACSADPSAALARARWRHHAIGPVFSDPICAGRRQSLCLVQHGSRANAQGLSLAGQCAAAAKYHSPPYRDV